MQGDVLEGADLESWRAFLRWSQGIHAAVNRAVVDVADLSVAEFEVLTRVWSHDAGALSQHALTTGLGWSASRTSHLLHRLEARGFIDRADTGQGRARALRLTDAGREHLLRAFDVHGRAFRETLLDRLTLAQRTALDEVMAHRTFGGANSEDQTTDAISSGP